MLCHGVWIVSHVAQEPGEDAYSFKKVPLIDIMKTTTLQYYDDEDLVP